MASKKRPAETHKYSVLLVVEAANIEDAAKAVSGLESCQDGERFLLTSARVLKIADMAVRPAVD